MKPYSAKRLTFVLIGSIFLSESLTHTVLTYLPPMQAWVSVLLDAVALSVLSFPFIYFFAFRPLQNNIKELRRAEEKLLEHHHQLEGLVKTRTSELNQSLVAAEKSSRAKSEFLASMSHELRTPLNAILGFSQLLRLRPDIPEDARVQVGDIENAGRHLLFLVNDVLDLARIEAGKLELSIEPVMLRAVIKHSLAIVAPMASKNNVEIINNIDSNNSIAVSADNSRLSQVLINFLSNAIKYNIPQGTVTLSCKVENQKVTVSVTDTGKGIPLEKQGLIFNESFNRLGSEQGTVEGIGIGLVITRNVVESMGGKVGFQSVEGQGSTFWFEIPQEASIDLPESDAKIADVAGAAEGGSGPLSEKPRLLIAEDNIVNQKLLNAILTKLGYSADVVEDGVKAVEAAESGKYGLILMDCQMPELNGYEATMAIRRSRSSAVSRVPIIAMTANAMQGDKETCIAAGMDDYLSKPIDIHQLREKLDHWLKLPLRGDR